MLMIRTHDWNDGSLRLPRNDKRTFKDLSGTRWLIYETTRGIGRFPLRPCLIFESIRAVHRIYVYPRDWRGLDSPALALLSGGR